MKMFLLVRETDPSTSFCPCVRDLTPMTRYSDEGSIPLLFAAIVNEDSRNPNITKQLIAAGADVNAPIR